MAAAGYRHSFPEHRAQGNKYFSYEKRLEPVILTTPNSFQTRWLGGLASARPALCAYCSSETATAQVFGHPPPGTGPGLLGQKTEAYPSWGSCFASGLPMTFSVEGPLCFLHQTLRIQLLGKGLSAVCPRGTTQEELVGWDLGSNTCLDFHSPSTLCSVDRNVLFDELIHFLAGSATGAPAVSEV